MARTTLMSAFFFLFVFLLVSMPDHSQASSNSQLKTVFSPAHSLVVRVANLRASRGDHSGSLRASLMAEKLERGLGLVFWGSMWSHGWDYAKNYAWRDLTYSELYGAVSDSNELLKGLVDVARMNSDTEIAARISRNYQNIFRSANSILRRLLKGPWREAVETIQMEVVEGGLLKDCLELGSNDLKGQPPPEFVRADIESLSNRIHQIEVTMTEHHREVMEYLREMMEYPRGMRQIIQDLVEANDDDVRPMSRDDDDYAKLMVGDEEEVQSIEDDGLPG